MVKDTGTRFDRRKAETKAKIFNVAIELFLAQGYEQTTIEQITAKADVAKGTFFNHFPTKEAVLCFLGEQRVEMLEEMFSREVSSLQSSKEKILRIFQVLSEENERSKEITALITREMFNRQSIGMQQERESQRLLRESFITILAEGQQQSEFRADFLPEHASDMLIGTYFYTLFQWLDSEVERSLEKELLERVQLIFKGLYI